MPDETLLYGPSPDIATAQDREIPGQVETPDWLRRAAPLPIPPQRLAAPSQLTEDRSAVSLPFGTDRKAALRRGRLIHALLQTLPEVANDQRRTIGRQFLAREPEISDDEIEEMLSVTMHTLDDPAFADVFAQDGRSEVAIVGTLPDGRMINGRVDRLIIRTDQILIIDYKTDRPAPTHSSQVENAYLVQMAAYRAVLKSIYQDRAVRCALLYTDGPRLIELDPDEMSESLNRVESRV
jgi:ATP-dependent helicase/nuclease subunit A